ncbi:MAG: head GIN domain-containing protein [Flavobacteriaceae bacterium]
MTTISKFITALIMSLLLVSCQFNGDFGFGVRGNGNVETVERSINDDFNEINVSRGMDVYLTQGDNVSLLVEADENLHDIIITEVKNGVLHITTDENIAFSKSKKVMLTFKDISKIKATSGSDVFSTNTIVSDNLELTTTSGSDMELDINVQVADCRSTSGSDLRVSGTTNKLYAEATSGSDIKAGNLKAKVSEARATSGADITVNTSDELYAKATSGGDIKYYGNPERVTKKDGVSGNISKQ